MSEWTGAVAIARDGTRTALARPWVPEAPVAFEFNGLAYAVMMATPANLADFATGFALSEGLIASAHDLSNLGIAELPDGWIVRATLAGLGIDKLTERVRARVAESSCGLCGIENLAEVARPLPPVAPHAAIAPEAIFAALEELPEGQELNRATGAAHAAAWCTPAGRIAELREDVGRHNALDKLIGAMARAEWELEGGFVLSTARCSYEIVEKSVRCGATTLVTVSLPTSLAVERAQAAGLSLWVLARDDSVTLVNDGSTA
jgi:FdhD protein